ncbi:MAG TPA: XcyI family restriction endonuclease [Planctomycetaceae bacterium]
MTDRPIQAPDPSRQIAFHQLLVSARRTWLIDALAEALSRIDPRQLKQELLAFVPTDAQRILAKAGIRDEHVFPTPIVICELPTLVGYYRLLLGVPQKSFYGGGTGMGLFKSMESRGTLSARQKHALPAFCRAMCASLADLVRQLSPSVTPRDVQELPLLTLGSYFQGANNVLIGKQATADVFLAIKEIVGDALIENDANRLVVMNASGRRVTLTLGSDPDINIEEEFSGKLRKKVAIEIKGGTDKSNAHNRAGEAEKSHQKAKNEGFRDFWTIIAKKGLDMAKLQSESPTTNSWFDVAHVLGRQGNDWDDFCSRLVDVLGIPSMKSP